MKRPLPSSARRPSLRCPVSSPRSVSLLDPSPRNLTLIRTTYIGLALALPQSQPPGRFAPSWGHLGTPGDTYFFCGPSILISPTIRETDMTHHLSPVFPPGSSPSGMSHRLPAAAEAIHSRISNPTRTRSSAWPRASLSAKPMRQFNPHVTHLGHPPLRLGPILTFLHLFAPICTYLHHN